MDQATRERIAGRLVGAVGARYVLADPYERRLYQYDASPETALPDLVVIPGSAEDVAAEIHARSKKNA